MSAIPRRARIEGSKTLVSLEFRLESNNEEKKQKTINHSLFLFSLQAGSVGHLENEADPDQSVGNNSSFCSSNYISFSL